MTALSFFSYKGGVGRTMALTNFAKFLTELGKSVFIIDFDLEAPGVPFKLPSYMSKDSIKTGIVDYIYDFSVHGVVGQLNEHVIKLRKNNPDDADLWLLPAGDADMDEYWKKLSKINWYNMFYTEGGNGLRFFLDLKEKIRKEYNPDFILIDSRTGITELSGISLKILADEVVLLFVNNEENIKGTEKVLSFLQDRNGKISDQVLRTHLVLTRAQRYKKEDRDGFHQEYQLVSSIKKRFGSYFQGVSPEIEVIHTDERLQMNEQLAFNEVNQMQGDSFDIYSEHLTLFENIFKNKFKEGEWEKSKNIKEASKLWKRARTTLDLAERKELLDKAINLDNRKWEYFRTRGQTFIDLMQYENAISDFETSYELSNKNGILIDKAWCLSMLGDNNAAMEIMNKMDIKQLDTNQIGIKVTILEKINRTDEALQILNNSISSNPKSIELLLNSRADLLRRKGNYSDALTDILEAIRISSTPIKVTGFLNRFTINTTLPVFYGTLAEIYAGMGKTEEFYHNLNIALSKGIKTTMLRSARDIYEKFREDTRFVELLRSYNLNSEDIFHDGLPGHSDSDAVDGDTINTAS